MQFYRYKVVDFFGDVVMYAVIKSGGKQYRVQEGDALNVELLDVEIGSTVQFNEVLAVGGEKTQIGTPSVKGAVVAAEVLAHKRDKKITVLKFRRRKDSMTKQGHRQDYTRIKIQSITA